MKKEYDWQPQVVVLNNPTKIKQNNRSVYALDYAGYFQVDFRVTRKIIFDL